MEEYPINGLPDKNIVYCMCPNCRKHDFHERPGIEPGFEYISPVKGEVYKCDACKTEMRAAQSFNYSFIVN